MKRAPLWLSKEARRWFNETLKAYELEEHHVQMVLQAAQALYRLTAAREAIQEHGLLVQTEAGTLKANPATGIERDQSVLFCRICRELGLDVETTNGEQYPRLPRQFGEYIRKAQ